jgi:hypothetical protein
MSSSASGRAERCAITTSAEHWNNNPTRFIRKATADGIITNVKPGRETLHQIKTQTDHYVPVGGTHGLRARVVDVG